MQPVELGRVEKGSYLGFDRHQLPATGATPGVALSVDGDALQFHLMSKVESLEREVEQLAPDELAAFRAWFIEHDWQSWDRELEQDVGAGRLDRFADEALAEYERGETTEL